MAIHGPDHWRDYERDLHATRTGVAFGLRVAYSYTTGEAFALAEKYRQRIDRWAALFLSNRYAAMEVDRMEREAVR